MKVVYKILFLFFVAAVCTPYCAAQDTITIKTDTVVEVHSPSKAALMSAILPGLGQIYNKKVWKVPVIYAGLSVNAYFLIRYATLFRNYRKGYVDYQNYIGSLAGDQPNSVVVAEMLADVEDVLKYSDVNAALKFYKDQSRRVRDLNILIMAGIYFINIIDATVDAYLFNYDIGENLSLKVEPTMINTAAYHSSVGLKLTFNLH